MHALGILGDPVRRRIVELLADGELRAGEIGASVQAEFGISEPAVSQHLRVLRDAGFTRVRADGTRRLYALQPDTLAEADRWFDQFRRVWAPRDRKSVREGKSVEVRVGLGGSQSLN